jgi:hypothetical protein
MGLPSSYDIAVNRQQRRIAGGSISRQERREEKHPDQDSNLDPLFRRQE